MSVDVVILDDGRLQATVDGLTGPALTIEAVQALYAKIPDAQNAANRQELTTSVRGLTDILVSADPTLKATITVTDSSLTATVDPATYLRMRDALGVIPDPATGALTSGVIVVKPAP